MAVRFSGVSMIECPMLKCLCCCSLGPFTYMASPGVYGYAWHKTLTRKPVFCSSVVNSSFMRLACPDVRNFSTWITFRFCSFGSRSGLLTPSSLAKADRGRSKAAAVATGKPRRRPRRLVAVAISRGPLTQICFVVDGSVDPEKAFTTAT
jgi:hypothetical protein